MFRTLTLFAGFVAITTASPLLADNADNADLLIEKTWPKLVADRKLPLAKSDTKLQQLLKQRHNAAVRDLRERYAFWLQSACSFDELLTGTRRVIESRLEVKTPAADHVSLLKLKVAFLQTVEKQAMLLSDIPGRGRNVLDVHSAKFARFNAEIELLRAEQSAIKSKK